MYITADGLGSPWNGNELRRLELSDIPFQHYALRRPKRISHEADWAKALNIDTRPIYPLPLVEFLLDSVAAPLIFWRHYFYALGNALFGKRENLRTRIAALAHFFVAAHWAMRVRREPIAHIHAQWAHSGCTVAMYGAWLLAKPFSFTGHAVDLFRQRVALKDKIQRAAFIVCISEFHRNFFLKRGADPKRLVLAYCGIDLAIFNHRPLLAPSNVTTILSAGRLIEKKGFADLIAACALLRKRGYKFKCIIGGSGPLEHDLREQIKTSALHKFVHLTGTALTQESIPAFMGQGHLFCLPCVWAHDDDVDGLPQLLMEAMACGLPAISTHLVGIPDLVIHGHTGLLVQPRAPHELAKALEFAINNPAIMARLAAMGAEHLKSKFDLSTSLDPLLHKYQYALSTAENSSSGA